MRRAAGIVLAMVFILGACRQTPLQSQQVSQAPAAGSRPGREQAAATEQPTDSTDSDHGSRKSAAAVSAPAYHVYAGSYPTRERAEEVVAELAGMEYSAELINLGDEFHVRVASCDNYENTAELRSELVQSGYSRAFATRVSSRMDATGDSRSRDRPSPSETGSAEEEPLDAGREAETSVDPPAEVSTNHETHWWESQLGDPGCVLMTWEECQEALAANREKRSEYKLELGNLRELLERNRYMVYVGSYRDREQAELAAAQAARHGIRLEAQSDAMSGWIAAAICDDDVGVAILHQQLDDAGLANNARWWPSASQLRSISDLQAELRELDRQDSAVRSYMTCFKY